MRPSHKYVALFSVLLGLFGLACGDSGAPNPPPPSVTVTGVTPASGPLTGETSVTITGTNFTNVTSVTVGGSELLGRAVVSSSQITGTTPVSTSAGAKDVVVTSATHGAGTCPGCFNYTAPSTPTFTALSLGSSHACGVTTVGAAYCWGDNQQGELGLGTAASPDRCFSGTPCSTLPLAVSGGLTFASISASGVQTCGLTTQGTAYCWGSNRYGQLGIGTAIGPERCIADVSSCSRVPLAVTGGLSFASLSGGSTAAAHTCGLTAAGAAYCWGLNQSGALGVGTSDGPESCTADINSPPRSCSTLPVPVSGGLSFASVSLGGGHSCGLTADGTAHCWGPNSYDERTDRVSPEPVPGNLSFAMVRIGVSIVCGVTVAGDAYCWGYNRFGRLGDGSPEETIRPSPGPVLGGLKFSAISVGSSHVCGLTTAGAAFCWGYNGNGSPIGGALGDGTTINRFAPVPVSGGLTFTQISVGGGSTCGLTSGGDTYCWGDNQSGQLGDGTTTGRLTPVLVTIGG